MQRRAILLLLFVGSVSFFIYLATLTHVHTFDALSYVLDVDRKPWQELFHPHHLAYGQLGVCIRALLHAIGWHGSVLLPLQVVNAAAGAAGITLFAASVLQTTHRVDGAVAGALLLGGSYAYWYYAIEVEVYTIAALFLIGCLWLMMRLLAAPRLRDALLLGVLQGFAVLFHQTNVLLCAPIGVMLLFVGYHQYHQSTHHHRLFFVQRWWLYLVGAYGVPFTIIAIGSYLVVGFGVSKQQSWHEFVQWMTAYAHTGWWGGAIMHNDVWRNGGQGITNTLAQPGGALLWLLLMGIVVLYARNLWHRYARVVWCCVAWIFVYGLFFMWWEPDNIEFWIASMPPLVLLVTVAAMSGSVRVFHPGIVVVVAIGITVASINYDAIVYRGALAHDEHRPVAHALAEASHQDDLLLVSDELLGLYLPYYESTVHTGSINQAMFTTGGNWQAACGVMQHAMNMALERGAAVLIAHDVLYPPREKTVLSDPIVQRFGLSPEQVTACFAEFVPYLQPLARGNSVLPRYYVLPAARVFADGDGWHFTHSRLGWQAQHVSDEWVEQGWHFRPHVDPQLVSPPLLLHADEYEAIEMQLSYTPMTTATAKFELFFVNDKALVDNTLSVERTLHPNNSDGTPHIYRVSLAGRPGWEGIITGLRIDPIGAGDGSTMRIDWVRFVLVGTTD